MKKLKFILPSMQLILTIVAVAINQSINNGHGEGLNQVIPNYLSNIEIYIKYLFGWGHIVDYDFKIITVLLAMGFWYIVGLSFDKLIKKIRSGAVQNPS